MLTRVLAQELGDRLPRSQVYADTSGISAEPDATGTGYHSARRRPNGDARAAGASGRGVQTAGGNRRAELQLRGAAARPRYDRRGRGDQHRHGAARGRRCGHARGTFGTAMSPTPCEPARGTPAAASVLRECPGCGLFQIVPALAPGTTARCPRCDTTLRRARLHALDRSAALSLAALILLAVMCASTLMTVQTAGIIHQADLFSGPEELVRRSMTALASVVVFVTVAAPLAKLLGTLHVLIQLHEAASRTASRAPGHSLPQPRSFTCRPMSIRCSPSSSLAPARRARSWAGSRS